MASLLTACSSTLPENSRNQVLAAFLEQPEHWFFYWPSPLNWEHYVFGEGLGKEFTDKFQLEYPVLQLMRDFIAATDLPAARILTPKELVGQNADPNTPVLFFSSSWSLIYRRWPPNMTLNKLSMGVVAKVIPLGQVMEGKGSLALRTAGWEGNCAAEAFDGAFLSRSEWEADNGARLKQAMKELQAKCADKLAEQFAAARP